MGYQESFIFTSITNIEENNKDLENILKIFKDWNCRCKNDVTVCVARVTFTKKIRKFEQGMQMLWLVGERGYQRSVADVFDWGYKLRHYSKEELDMINKVHIVYADDLEWLGSALKNKDLAIEEVQLEPNRIFSEDELEQFKYWDHLKLRDENGNVIEAQYFRDLLVDCKTGVFGGCIKPANELEIGKTYNMTDENGKRSKVLIAGRNTKRGEYFYFLRKRFRNDSVLSGCGADVLNSFRFGGCHLINHDDVYFDKEICGFTIPEILENYNLTIETDATYLKSCKPHYHSSMPTYKMPVYAKPKPRTQAKTIDNDAIKLAIEEYAKFLAKKKKQD